MQLPDDFIKARELADQSFRLACRGFLEIIKGGNPSSESVYAFAKMIESFRNIEKDFSAIGSDRLAIRRSEACSY